MSGADPIVHAEAPRPDDIDLRLRFESLLADLSAGFVNLPPDRVDGAVIDAQRRICECFGLDRSALWQAIGSDPEPWWLTHVHQVPARPLISARPMAERSISGVTITVSSGDPPVELRGDASTLFPWIVAQLRRGETVTIPSVDNLPAEAAHDQATLRQIGTRSTVAVPLIAGGIVHGTLSFGAMGSERTWPEAIVQRFHLIAQVFASALARKQAELRLRESEAQLRRAVEDLQQLRDQLQQENVYLRAEAVDRQRQAQIAGQSPAIRFALAQAERVAATTSTVLLVGETGTGKERFATVIHELSARRNRPMVRVNCAAIPATLVESELFGREKGAYTGALSRQAGRFELAHGSTLFLDEIGALPTEVQVKLLRVLQEKQVERLGSPKPIPVDVRIIAATNQDLEAAVHIGQFREDLYYRLNVFPIVIPPLRERRGDIPMLAQLFVEEFATAMGKRIDAIARTSMDALVSYDWPGNVRELRNVIERAMILATGRTLRIDMPHHAAAPAPEASRELREVDQAHILAVLQQTGWRIRGPHGAARILGLKPTTLETKMAKLGIARPEAVRGKL
jgi:transcriptional regulator with GAF, ATPase, and Fis domain